MSFVPLGLAVALLAYGAINVLGTVLAAVPFFHVARIPDAGIRARRLIVLRLLPSLASFVAVGVFVVPAYLWFEPRDTMERVRSPMVALAALGLLMLLAGPLRALASVLATRRLSKRWRRRTAPLSVPGIALPALVVDEPFPLVSVVGWFRPRLVVAQSVLSCCDRDELAAILAHEAGHTERRDPWVRLMVRACPDFLSLTPWADRMERVWTAAAEQDADELAARTGPTRAMDLASALVKVARLAGAGRPPAAATMALYRGEGVSARVVRLLEREGRTRVVESSPASSRRLLALAPVALIALVCVSAAFGAHQRVHGVLELIVNFLQ